MIQDYETGTHIDFILCALIRRVNHGLDVTLAYLYLLANCVHR